MKKIICTLIASVLVCTSMVGLVGCPAPSPIKIDETKTQLYVGNYNGGVGDDWLDADDGVIARFEEKYADYELNGKTGVQIILDSDKDCQGKTLKGTIGGDKNEVYFTQQVLYYDYVAEGLVRDITSLVNKQNPEDNNKSILSKFYASDVENLKVNNKYYAIPHYEIYDGLTYDAYVFQNEKLYFSDSIDTDGTRKFIINYNTKKSCGPNGIYGDYDDGLPSSYQEFYKLLDKMKSTVDPIVWAGEQTHYTNMMLSALYANYIGAEGLSINLDYDSNGKEIEVIKSFTGNTPNVEKVVISEANDNQNLLKNTAGLYYAIEALAKIFSDKAYYYDDSASGSFSFTTAQETFLESGLDGSRKIGMMIEGSYWYNEADSYGVIDRMDKYPLFATQKDPRFMPLPRQYSGTVTEGNGKAPVLVDAYNAYSFINSKIDANKVDLAEKFLAFCYTDAELVNFTKSTGALRALDYDYSSVVNDLSGYGKSVVEIRLDAKNNNSFVKCISNDPIFKANMNALSLDISSTYFQSPKCGDGYVYLWTAVNQGKKSAKEYFQGMWINKSDWNSIYKQ